MDLEENINNAALALKEADAILITAGAGIGVDSGLPDFRGNKGFWKAYPPIGKLGISFVDMANPMWFQRKPHLIWGFYGHRLNLYRRTNPHKGFSKVLEIANQKPGKYFVFTSNVDGQFQKAGYDDERIEECHGSIHHLQCTGPCCYDIWDASDNNIIVDEEVFEAQEPLPSCVHCSALARPNILMFGDWNWISNRTDDQSRRYGQWLYEIAKEGYKLAIIEMGAGEAVPTVRMNSEAAAGKYNATLIRINPRDYHTPSGNISIPLSSAEGVSQIYQKYISL